MRSEYLKKKNRKQNSFYKCHLDTNCAPIKRLVFSIFYGPNHCTLMYVCSRADFLLDSWVCYGSKSTNINRVNLSWVAQHMEIALCSPLHVFWCGCVRKNTILSWRWIAENRSCRHQEVGWPWTRLFLLRCKRAMISGCVRPRQSDNSPSLA
jgi:hypothetical protein